MKLISLTQLQLALETIANRYAANGTSSGDLIADAFRELSEELNKEPTKPV